MVVTSAGLDCREGSEGLGDGLDDPIGLDDAEVVVGDERERAAALARSMPQHDRAGRRDAKRTAGQHPFRHVQIPIREAFVAHAGGGVRQPRRIDIRRNDQAGLAARGHHPGNRRGNLAARAEVHGDLVMLQPVDEQLQARVARQRGALVIQPFDAGVLRGSRLRPLAIRNRRHGCGPGSGFLPRCRSSRGPPLTKRLPGDGRQVARRRPGRGRPRRAADVTVRHDRPLEKPANRLRQFQQPRIVNVASAAFMAIRSPAGPLSSTMRARRWMRISGMLILTGQTS